MGTPKSLLNVVKYFKFFVVNMSVIWLTIMTFYDILLLLD